MKKLTVMLDDELYTAVKVEAARKNQKLKDFISDALGEWLEIQEDAQLLDEAMREYDEVGGVPLDEAFRELEEEERKSA